MSGLGPKKEAAVALWDVAGQIHQFVNGAQEVAKEAAEVAVEEIKEVAQGKNTLGTTESTAAVVKAVEEVAKVVQPFSPLVQDMCPLINNGTTSAFVAPIVETAKNASTALCAVKPVVTEAAQTAGNSYLSYALGGLGTLVGGYGLYRLYNARKQAKQVLPAETNAVLEDSSEFLTAFPQLAANPLVKAFLQALTPEQAQALKMLEEVSKGALAGIAAMSPQQQLIALQTAVAPVATIDPAAILTEVLASNLGKIGGTEAVSSKKKDAAPVAAAPVQTLAQTIMVSSEAKQILAIIEAKPNAKAVLDTMSKEGLEGLARNSNAQTLERVKGMNGATLEAFLKAVQTKYAPKVEDKVKVKPN